jgi:hypothetical protein
VHYRWKHGEVKYEMGFHILKQAKASLRTIKVGGWAERLGSDADISFLAYRRLTAILNGSKHDANRRGVAERLSRR